MKSPPPGDTAVKVLDAIHALAFIGDLSMGQPTDHSLRTAWLSARLAAAAGHGAGDCEAVQQVSLLRWSGCTANAPEFSGLLGDDVLGRAVMLSQNGGDPVFADVVTRVQPAARALTQIHCEVSGDIARLLGVGSEVELALRRIFETYDGAGLPDRRRGADVPAHVFIVALASDLEIIGRMRGPAQAMAVVAHKAGSAYPKALADIAVAHAGAWLASLDEDESWRADVAPGSSLTETTVALELVADVIDLKLPWMAGNSRRVAEAADKAARAMGLGEDAVRRCYRAALLHGIGRAAVPNTVWDTPGSLSSAAREQVRLVPYWTARAAQRIGSLAADADIASYAGERLDGSGHFRACKGEATPVEGRVVAAATAWVALQSDRPWRCAFTAQQAMRQLRLDADAGRFDTGVVAALCGVGMAASALPAAALKLQLTEREIAVFRGISRGQTNKEVAIALHISPSTVRTHVEKVFRKLDCTTRAAATLKAMTLRLI